METGSLPFCEVLEMEFAALTGTKAHRLPSPRFEPRQLLDVHALASRLIDGSDRVAAMLRDDLLTGDIAALGSIVRTGDDEALAQSLSDAFNRLLDDPRLFDTAHRRAFDGVVFRSQTADRIAGGADPILHRLMLEDAFPEWRTGFDLRVARVWQRAHRARLRALCLSGGGIRSASFALGVLQGLARCGVLSHLDYLSTVSGGGYAGSWLSAWIARTSLDEVVRKLADPPTRPLEPEPEPVRSLRSFTSYLAPMRGLLSADSWTLIATWLRNLMLNWIAVVPPVVAIAEVPWLLLAMVRWQPVGGGRIAQYVAGWVLFATALAASIAAIRYVHLNRPRAASVTSRQRSRSPLFDRKRSQREFLHQCLLPLGYAAIASTIVWAWASSYASQPVDTLRQFPIVLLIGIVGAVVHLAGWMLAELSTTTEAPPRPLQPMRMFAVVVTGFGVGAFAGWLTRFAPPLWEIGADRIVDYVWLSTPIVLAIVTLSSQLYVGYTSVRQRDAQREWSARFSAWILIVSAIWLGLSGLILRGSTLLHGAAAFWSTRASWVGWVALAMALGCAAVAVTVAASSRTPATEASHAGGGKGGALRREGGRPGGWSRLAMVFAVIFLAWLVTALGAAAAWAIALCGRWIGAGPAGSTTALLAVLLTAAILLVFGLVSSACIDVNMFSLHAMYRMRLIRAFLGASRRPGERDPNRFTGFDERDNLPLRELWPRSAAAVRHSGPLHIINATLNLVGGGNLAWQERQAESFTFSPLHCGSRTVGYRRTQDDPRDPHSGGYGGEFGVSLGTAMAISGAAASPDMGYHSSPLLSLLLAWFDVRLGWWLGNPGHAGRNVYRRSRPRSSLRPLFDEAFGRTDDRNEYVYLSDGGHFENLGLYEMVLRRCHLIVVSDATADPRADCLDLGNAIRKIRIDLGVPIDIDTERLAANEQKGGLACATGIIRYNCVDENAPDGVLVVIKATAAASVDGPADVRAYHREHPAFPNQSTVDQTFTESQFESYRELGSRIVSQVVGDGPPRDVDPIDWFVARAVRVGGRARRSTDA